MKLVCVVLCWLVVHSVWAEESNLTLVVDGVTYENVTFETNTATTVKIRHSAGVARLPLAKLPPELQERFGYHPKKAASVATNTVVSLPSPEPPSTNPPPMGSTAYLDWRYGFRDLTFGQALGTCKGMTGDTNSTYGSQTLTRRDENLTLGAAKLKQVLYSFYEQKLVGVVVNFEPDGAATVLGILQQAYGKGTEANNEIVWTGDKVQAGLSRSGASFYVHSRALAQEQQEGIKAKKEQDEKTRLQEAAKGL